MVNLKRIIAVTSAVMLTFSASGCKKKDKKPEKVSSAEESIEVTPPTNERTLYWLSDFDLNPQSNSKRSAALAMFEDTYNSKIEYIHVNKKDKYNELANRIMSGEQTDIVPFDMESIPQQALNGFFQPFDDYYDILDMENAMWDDMDELIGQMKYKDSHYVIPYALSNPNLLIYSKTVMNENGLEDPYTLYNQGKWTWSKFVEQMNAFVSKNGGYGVCGNLGKGLVQSFGEPVVSYSNGTFSNNMGSANLEKAENLISDIRAAKLYNDELDTYFPDNRKTLFFAMSDWALPESNIKNPDAELMIVPFPMPDDAFECSSGFDISAIMLVSGSQNAEAAAAYINCERTVNTTPEYQAIVRDNALKENKLATGVAVGVIKDYQYDAITSYLSPANVKPVVDFGYGMGSQMYGTDTYAYDTRGIINNMNDGLLNYNANAQSWQIMRDTWNGVADVQIQGYNK